MKSDGPELIVFSVFDEKAGTFAPPFFFATVGMALRAFADLAQDRATSLNRHPGDFKMYRLGVFNQGSGKLLADLMPSFLASAAEFVPPVIAAAAAGKVEEDALKV